MNVEKLYISTIHINYSESEYESSTLVAMRIILLHVQVFIFLFLVQDNHSQLLESKQEKR